MTNKQLGSFIDTLCTPIGLVEITASDIGVTSILFVDSASRPAALNEHIAKAKAQLMEYFSKQRTEFSLALSPYGTDFQRKVWQALQTIPYGVTGSYSDIANAIGNPKAVRAVGAANGKNPLSIVVPCHRIIGKNGTLTGYAGGMERKAALLNLETATQ